MTYFDEYTEAKIRRFVQGNMDSKEADDFRRELEQNRELREEVDLFRSLQFITKHASLIEANRQISESVKDLKLDPDFHFSGEFGNSKGGSWSSFGRLSALLLALTAIIFALWWSFQQPAPKSAIELEAIAQPYLQPFENIISTNPEETSPLSMGMKAYDAKNYSEAIEHLSRYVSGTEDNNARLYLGISFLLNNEVDKAHPIFESLSKMDDTFSPTAKWYLGLCFLKEDRVNDAKEILSEITTHPVHGIDAFSVLNKLDNKNK